MLSQTSFYGLASVLIATALLPTSCDPDYTGGPSTADVAGTVMLDGQPVPDAKIVFIPCQIENIVGRPQKMSYGTTDALGNFTLHMANGDPGAAKGLHRVVISKLRDGHDDEEKSNTDSSAEDKEQAESIQKAISVFAKAELAQPSNEEIPIVYNRHSELTFNVDTSLTIVRAKFELHSVDPLLE